MNPITKKIFNYLNELTVIITVVGNRQWTSYWYGNVENKVGLNIKDKTLHIYKSKSRMKWEIGTEIKTIYSNYLGSFIDIEELTKNIIVGEISDAYGSLVFENNFVILNTYDSRIPEIKNKSRYLPVCTCCVVDINGNVEYDFIVYDIKKKKFHIYYSTVRDFPVNNLDPTLFYKKENFLFELGGKRGVHFLEKESIYIRCSSELSEQLPEKYKLKDGGIILKRPRQEKMEHLGLI